MVEAERNASSRRSAGRVAVVTDKEARTSRGPGQAITVKRLKDLLAKAEAEYAADQNQKDESKKLSSSDRVRLISLMQRISAMLVAKDRYAAMIRATKLAGERKAGGFQKWA